MRNDSETTPSAIGEFALWIVSGLFLSAMALMAMTAAKYLFGWSDSQWIASSISVGLLSATWGSWAALLWTRSRVLKTFMIAFAVLPGILMTIVGAWAFFHVPDNPWVWRTGWIVVAAHGLGAIAATALLGGRSLMGSAQHIEAVRLRRVAVGWTLYPVAVVVGSVAIVAVSFAFLPDLFCGDDTELRTLARWVVPSQALILLTTVLPAAASRMCDFLTRPRSS